MSETNSAYVILNGELVAADEARVPADDRGFLYGDSVFTTLRCYGGVPFRLERHCARLNASLTSPVVGIKYEVNEATLRKDIARLVELNDCPDVVARFQVTRGRGAGPLPPANPTPTTLLTVQPYSPKESLYTRGASLIVSSVRRDPDGELGKHKLGSYFSSLLARRVAAAASADDAIICDTDGNYLECASSNIFAVAEGVLITPDVTENLLPGLARETVLECVADLGLEVRLERLTAEIAESAEELFITNSILEVVPVTRVENKEYSAPGPITTELMRAYAQLVAKEMDNRPRS